jgi:hypothetical protein
MLLFTDALLIALVTGAGSGLMAWGALRLELRYMKREINAAHRRLDKINAPPAWVDLPVD